MKEKKILLVGDNPFQGVSHLSQERARTRGKEVNNPEYAAELITISLDNGADGFMFSVSETTISILRMLPEKRGNLKIYAIVPAAYDYVRLASQLGTPGLLGYFVKQLLVSRNLKAIVNGLKGLIEQDVIALMKAYLLYEVFRVKSSIGRKANIYSLLLHEIVTDMALALNFEWLFRSYVNFMLGLKIKPGFETRNFPYLVNKLKAWNIDFGEITIVAPFNKIGFQMNPSRIECEKALINMPEAEVIAMSPLASGYLKLSEAIEYIRSVPQLKGVAVGVSKQKHADEFKFIREALEAEE
ncbi:MAG: hypothetical protein QXO75_11015 [Nitrososphaerota archaeon]